MLLGMGDLDTRPRELLNRADAITLAILFATVACGYLLLLLPLPQDQPVPVPLSLASSAPSR